MKKYLLMAALVAATSVQAADFYPTASLKSPHGTIIRNIVDTHTDGDWTAKQTGGCGESVTLFESTSDPVAIIQSNSAYRNSLRTKQNCVINYDDARIVFQARMPYQLCHKPGLDLSAQGGKRLSFGNTKHNPQIDQLADMNSNKYGIEFYTVTHNSSNHIAQSIVNGDIDVGFLAIGNARKVMESGAMECSYSTGSFNFGEKPLADLIGENKTSSFTLSMTAWVRNMSEAQVNKMINDLKPLVAKLEAQDLVNVKAGPTQADVAEFVAESKALEFTN